MSVCCRSAAVPRIHKLGGRMPSSSTGGSPSTGLQEESSELIAATLCSVPPSASREFKGLLVDIRAHQEQLFAQVLNQQQIFQKHLEAIEAGIRATSSAQIVSNRRQEDFFAEIRDLSFKSENVNCEETDAKTVETPMQQASPMRRASSDEKNGVPMRQGSFDATKRVPMRQGTFNAKDDVARVSTTKSVTSAFDTACAIANQDSKLKTDLGSCNTGDKSRDSRRERARRFLQSKEFELALAAAILTNSLVMCFECQYQGLDVGFNLKFPGRSVQAHVVWEGAESVFMIFDWLFGCLFLLEMVVKLVCWRQNYFFEPPEKSSGFFNVEENLKKHRCGSQCSRIYRSIQGWNLLDTISVCAFLTDKIGAAGVIKPQMIRLLRLFKLGRLVRLLRFVESLDHLYVMTTAISGLKKILLWAIVLLSLMLLTCDLFLVQTLQATYFNHVKAGNLTEEELQRHHQMYEYFGTCTRCMLSMFEITLGNWPPIARLLSEEVSEWFIVICLAHKLTIGFAVIGVITGCILQETFKVAQTDDIIMFRQKKMAHRVLQMKMRALYEALDVTHDGKLQLAEVQAISLLPEIKTWLSSLDIETDDLHMLFDLIDVDMDGYITLDELCKRMPRIKGNARSIDVLAMQKQLWKNAQRLETEGGEAQACFADFVLA